IAAGGVYHETARRASGLWALTCEETTETLRVTQWSDPNVGDAELSAIRRAYLAAHPELAHLGAGDRTTMRVLWDGVAHTAGTAMVAALWLVSTPALWRWPRRRRERRRAAAGLCARCGYELAGLPAGALCPECGLERGTAAHSNSA